MGGRNACCSGRCVDAALEIEHQKFDIDVLFAGHVPRPAETPFPHRHDDGLQSLASRGRMIFVAPLSVDFAAGDQIAIGRIVLVREEHVLPPVAVLRDVVRDIENDDASEAWSVKYSVPELPGLPWLAINYCAPAISKAAPLSRSSSRTNPRAGLSSSEITKRHKSTASLDTRARLS